MSSCMASPLPGMFLPLFVSQANSTYPSKVSEKSLGELSSEWLKLILVALGLVLLISPL